MALAAIASARLKVVLIHQYFIDPSRPGATRPYDLVRVLTARGHEVVVLTGEMNLLTRQGVVLRSPTSPESSPRPRSEDMDDRCSSAS